MIMTYKNEWTRTLALTAIGLASLLLLPRNGGRRIYRDFDELTDKQPIMTSK